MQKERLLTVFAVMLLAVSAFAPAATLSRASDREVENGPTSGQAALADSESTQLIIPVSEDEGVVNSTPDTNYNFSIQDGGLFVGMEPSDPVIAHSWLKYDMSHISDTVRIQSAALFVHLNHQYTPGDLPIGVYYSADDNWKETTITWNNQPDFSSAPSDSISSPPSPDMFLPKHWYSWDVTSDVITTIAGDKILSEVLKVVNESESFSCFKYFTEKDYSRFNASYLVLNYAAPAPSNLKVDGYFTSPHIDYIMDATPTLSWEFSDADTGDTQKGYDVEVYEGGPTGSPVWHTNTTEIITTYSSATDTNAVPFGAPDEMRYQMKIPKSVLSRTGIVDKLFFEISSIETGAVILESLSVSMLSVSSSTDLGATFANNYEGLTPTQVLYSDAYVATIANSWLMIDVQNTFILSNRSNLLIELRFMEVAGLLVSVNTTTSLTGASVAYTGGTGAYTDPTAANLSPRAHNVKIEFASTEVFARSTSNNNYPFNWATAKMQFKYNRSLINTEGYVDRVMFGVNELDASATFYNLTIRLVETPVEGQLNETFSLNYGGVTPTVVLQENAYHPSNLGQWLVFDVANNFYYSNSHNLLIEISFDVRSGDGMHARYRINSGGYRSFNMTDSHATKGGQDASTYELNLDMIHPQQQFVYGGSPLVNGTTYYFQASVCDSLGIWSPLASLVFRYEIIHGIPTWKSLTVSPSPVYIGQPVTVSIEVEYLLGVNAVLIEYGGFNHTMSLLGMIYSHSWTPPTTGLVSFKIYMESFTGDWNTTSGSFQVQQGGLDTTLLLIVGVGAVAAVLVVALLLHHKRKE